MGAMDWHERISIDPNICRGQAYIKGTRVIMSVILENLAAGDSWESIKEGYHVTREDIQAALCYTANIIKEYRILLEFHRTCCVLRTSGAYVSCKQHGWSILG
jgi:uncharacterized protein (DUF433 family)